MYKIYCEIDKNEFPVINIEGKLDSSGDITQILNEIKNLSNSIKESIKIIIVDLSKTDYISEEWLEMFQKLRPVYNLEFRNFSLYIELLLKEYDLLNTTN